MAVKVGINGFGRIGRVVFRSCLQNPGIQITAINDPAIDSEYVCYLIKFDSTHGKFKGNIASDAEGELIVNGQQIKVFHEKLPTSVPWQSVGVQYVVEASGMFTCLEKASGHLVSEGVKHVIVTAPSVDVPMIIIGVNDNKLKPEHKVVSCASSTLYCLAPIIKILDDEFGVAEGFVTSIHAMTPSLKPLDGLCLRGKHWRDHRSIHQNIIPATTGACKALGKIIPQVKDKLSGLAFRVPIVDVSVLDLSIRLNANTTLQDVTKLVEKVSNLNMKNIIRISNEQAVSSDFIGDSHSCIFDVDSSLQLKADFFKIICWYENEYSYACRIIDTIFACENQFRQQIPRSLTFVKPNTPKKPESCKKEIPLTCNSVLNSKILRSTSQDTVLTTKQVARSVIVKKPNSHTSRIASSLSSYDPKKNEMFKIWNDSSHTVLRQNRNSLFQCCFNSQSKEKTDCVKAQERLESVKKEFSKMVNITEDLLKKSHSKKFQFSTLETTSKEDVNLPANVDLNPSPCDDFKTLHETIDVNEKVQNGSIVNKYDNNKNTFGVKNTITKNTIKQGVLPHDNCGDRKLIVTEKKQLNTNVKYATVKQEPPKVNILTKNTVFNSNNQSDKQTDKSKFNDQVEKTINKLIDGLSQKIRHNQGLKNELEATSVQIIKKNATIMGVKDRTKLIENEEKDKGEPVKDVKQTLPQHKISKERNTDVAENPPDIYNLKDFAKYLQNENYNMRVVEEELKKRNIILISNHKYDTNHKYDSELFISRSFGSENLTENVGRGKEVDFKKGILKCLNKFIPEPVIVVPEDSSGFISPDNTALTRSHGDIKHCKQDIYDKLDSTSGTDSNGSFDIHERKSQVIHITDITNSLEDLGRLDKICRIIEISDELSDKLFSPLSDCEGQKLEKKKWSFKDLCDKIKLDDFCNTVFGKTAI